MKMYRGADLVDLVELVGKGNRPTSEVNFPICHSPDSCKKRSRSDVYQMAVSLDLRLVGHLALRHSNLANHLS
jgi:hypothetical protein